MPETAPYGSWKSPITADLIVQGTVGLGQVMLDGEDVYWIEARPAEKGRNVIVRRTPDGQCKDVNPPETNVRTRVHEYGGGAYAVRDGGVCFSNFTDQRLLMKHISSVMSGYITPETQASDLRFADAVFDFPRNRLICICEDHTVSGKEPVNKIISIGLSRKPPGWNEMKDLVTGCDFFSSPRLSPDGKQLAWLSWNHPNMPWDESFLWVAEVKDDGSLWKKHIIAGGVGASIFQPEWSPDGALHFVSDRYKWWNLYRYKDNKVEALCPMEAEFGMPQWVFRMSTYAFLDARRILCTFIEKGHPQLGILDTTTQQLTRLDTPYSKFDSIRAANGRAVFTAGSPTQPTAVVEFNPDSGEFKTLRRAGEMTIDPDYISVPEAVEYPTEQGLTAHAFYYPPRNRDFVAPAGEKPPLVVEIHGGPTAATYPVFNLGIQYWTSRGIGVLDVNYGGSTGYGRDYRERLNGNWGVVDVDDCVNGAKYLAERGLADANRLAITGGSAGGYTTLCALTFRDVFRAGASHYGVSDLVALDEDTHKFEAKYTQRLVGPWPASRDLYIERSPIHHTDRLSAPVIFFQGLDDKIVPPNQAEMMVEALRKKGLPVAYVAFEGEQHGF